MPQDFRLSQGMFGSVVTGRGGCGVLSRAIAARLMKGVVRPQQAPTIRKEITQRQVDGLGMGGGISESMV